MGDPRQHHGTRIAFFSVLIVILLRLILFFAGHAPEGTAFMPVHLLALIALPFIAGHLLLRDRPEASFPDLFRTGFRAAALYAALYAVFIWAYFHWIDVTAFPIRVNAMVERAVAEGHGAEEARRRFEGFFAPFNYATITLVALLLLGALNSLVLGLLHHKVLRTLRR